MPAKPIPDGYERATPYLICHDATGAIEFYKKAFGATELFRMPMPTGKLGHAEIKVGGAIIMLADECPESRARSPQALGGTTVGLHIYVEDVDGFARRAESAGVEVLEPVTDKFYGDRSVTFRDPCGHIWSFATHKEDLSPAEIQKRLAALGGAK